MSKENILIKLRENGIKEGYFEEKRLCDLEKSCSKSELLVVDYDETKKKVQQCLPGFKQFESCDALKINKEYLDFIEMKSLDLYLKHYSPKTKRKFMEKDFGEKYTDSIYLLSILLNRNDMKIEKSERTLIMKSISNYIVLIDREYVKEKPEEFLARLEFLKDTSSFEREIIYDSFEEVAAANENEEEKHLKEVIDKIQNDLMVMQETIPHRVNPHIMTPNEFREYYC